MMQEEINKLNEKIRELQSNVNELQEKLDNQENDVDTFPKKEEKYWGIKNGGDVSAFYNSAQSLTDKMKEIGNCFRTEEEAELAVQKLKALKRLRDRGFKVVNWDWCHGKAKDIALETKKGQPWYGGSICTDPAVVEDLNTLFAEDEK